MTFSEAAIEKAVALYEQAMAAARSKSHSSHAHKFRVEETFQTIAEWLAYEGLVAHTPAWQSVEHAVHRALEAREGSR